MSVSSVTCGPSRLEAWTLSRSMGRGAVLRVGMGAGAACRAAARPVLQHCDGLLVAGIGGGVHAGLRAGDVVVATEVRGPGGTISCPSAPILAGQLTRARLVVRLGPVASASHLVTGTERAAHAGAGVLCVDMESAWLLDRCPGAAGAVVRVVADDADHRLVAPGTPRRLVTALRMLSRTGPSLTAWGRAVGPRRVLLAGPRSSRAGVSTHRQRALHAIAAESDLVLVVGPASSASSQRLVESAARLGRPVHLIDDAGGIDLAWLEGVRTVGVTAGASALTSWFDDIVDALAGLGPVEVAARDAMTENVRLTLPKEAREP